MNDLTLITLHVAAIGGSLLVALGLDRLRQRRARTAGSTRSIPAGNLAPRQDALRPSGGDTSDHVLEMPGRNVFEMPGRTVPVRSLYPTLQQETV